MSAKYTPEEIKLGLTAYAAAQGNQQKTEALQEREAIQHIPFGTIRCWRQRDHRELYEQIKGDLEEQIGSEFADRHLELAHAASEIEALATDQLREKLAAKEIAPKDLARIAKDAAVVVAVHTDKYQMLSGKPTVIVQNDYPDLKKALERHGVHLTIEGEAIEEPDPPQLVEATVVG